METLRLFKFILTVTYWMGITVDLVAVDAVPWSDHFALKIWLGTLCPPGLGRE